MSYSMSLNLQQKQSLKQNQRLMMSPQMQQAIHLLQIPVLELQTMIEAELEQNPILEYMEEEPLTGEDESLAQSVEEEVMDLDTLSESEVVIDDHDFDVLKRLDEDFKDYFAESSSPIAPRTRDDAQLQAFQESSICQKETLFTYLMEQAQNSFESANDLRMAEEIIGNLDESGFFTCSLEELALINDFDLKRFKEILLEIQTFDPPGIAAVKLQESLLIQLQRNGKKDKLAYIIIEKHFDDLTHNRIPLIHKSLGCSVTEIRESIDNDIAKLDLHPGFCFIQPTIQPITVDVFVTYSDNILKVDVNRDALPPLRLNKQYLNMLEDPSLPIETKEYVKQKVLSGKWLLRNIHQRNETLEKIVNSLVNSQKDFFTQLNGQLNPLTMKAVAEELELHESTIARAVANKYIDCPRGLFPLRFFFTNSYVTEKGEDISSSTVKEVLLELIAKEDKCRPFSDEMLSLMMKEKGITCARRTVAKYRKLYNIGNVSQRKNYK